MLTCTEFIPLYSQFFKYLSMRDGDEAVMKYWIHISDTSIGDKTNPNSLASKCELYGGFKGAQAYWGHTHSEEACDTLKITNNEKKYIYSLMRHCPSKGMLNSLTHIEPYHDYCGHCKVIYSRVLEKYGVTYERDQRDCANARCSSFIYETGHRPDFDYTKPTPECIVADEKREGVKYLHRDFHLLGDNALCYCRDKYGIEGVRDFLSWYTKDFFSPRIKKFKEGGLHEVEKWLCELYEIEEASELLHTALTDDTLSVTVDRSPVIDYMHTLGKEPSDCYIEETRSVYAALAEASGLGFSLDEYDDKTGAAKYRFFK